MSEQPFDALTRRAEGEVSRRASLLAIGATGLAAMLGGSLTATAKNNKNNKRNKKKDKNKTQQRAEQECEEQVAQCQSILTAIGGIPVNQLTCCEFLGACDFPQFSLCFFGT
jgi:hypothetical protein